MLKGISPAEAAKFETLFKLLDIEGTGSIDESALADLMPRMGVFPSEEELHALLLSVDTDGSGCIDFHEFLLLMSRNREANQLALLEGGRQCFQHLKAASKLKHVIRSDDPISWLLDMMSITSILFYTLVTTYEDVRRSSDSVRFEAKAVFAVFLIIDVIRCMFTSNTPDGADTLPVDDKPQARRAYLKSSRFLLDLIAALPLDIVLFLVGNDYAGRLCQHTRLVKFLVYPKLFKLSPRDILSPTYAHFYFTVVPLTQMLFWALVVVHLLSLFWILISPADEFTYIDATYFVMYTITTTGYGDVRVTTDGQKLYCIFLFCCASVVTGLVVGKLVQFSQRADLQADESKRMLETLAALNHLTIPDDFKEEVLAFQLHRLKHSNSLFNDAISGLPQAMQDRMALYARMKIVRQVPIFQKAPEICVAKLAQSLVNVFVPPEEYIMIAGEEGEEMFFLFHGMCGVTLPNGKWVATIARGGVFGEVALLEETRRSASIKSLTYCQLFRLDKVLPQHSLRKLRTPPPPTSFHPPDTQAAFESIVNLFPVLLDSIQRVSVALQMRIEYATGATAIPHPPFHPRRNRPNKNRAESDPCVMASPEEHDLPHSTHSASASYLKPPSTNSPRSSASSRDNSPVSPCRSPAHPAAPEVAEVVVDGNTSPRSSLGRSRETTPVQHWSGGKPSSMCLRQNFRAVSLDVGDAISSEPRYRFGACATLCSDTIRTPATTLPACHSERADKTSPVGVKGNNFLRRRSLPRRRTSLFDEQAEHTSVLIAKIDAVFALVVCVAQSSPLFPPPCLTRTPACSLGRLRRTQQRKSRTATLGSVSARRESATSFLHAFRATAAWKHDAGDKRCDEVKKKKKKERGTKKYGKQLCNLKAQ